MGAIRATGGQIWDTTKTYMSSNIVKKYDAVLAAETSQELGTFAMTHHEEAAEINNELKADPRLQKYTIKQMIPTKKLDEFENPNQVYLITDEKGHDIGICEISGDGSKMNFRLPDKIQEGNQAILEAFPEGPTRDILREKYNIETLDELCNKLAKGEEIALHSVEQAKDDIDEMYEENKFSTPNDNTYEDPEEKEAISKIPSDMRYDVVKQCKEQGIKIKEALIVDCPECVSREMGKGENHINENGGPIVMIKAQNDGFDGAEDLYMFQDGQDLPDVEKNQDRIVELMDQHKDEGAIQTLEDTREDEIIAKLDEIVQEYEHQIEEYQKAPFSSEEDRSNAIDNCKRNMVKDTFTAIGDYVPDDDGKVADYVEAIQYEATPDAIEENNKIQKDINKIIAGTALAVFGVATLGAIGNQEIEQEQLEEAKEQPEEVQEDDYYPAEKNRLDPYANRNGHQ